MSALVVLVTCPDRRVAVRIAEALIARRLAACVNLVPGLTSVYEWKGAVERSSELLLIIKTTPGRYPALEQAVASLHPYDVPEVIALPVSRGRRAYLAWMTKACRGRRGRER
jgi:periplasmic divalent cation tolerance protein